ncbi:MAG TPA: PAS domain S-box protein, partial [Clostridia bacterium]|nr:PAS domain S-box protein [Clostridia bacterium]
MNKQTRILLVDDDEAILDVYSQLLELEGYEVWQASSGLQGLQMTRERHPHLVLLDVMLPDMSGLEVCRQIKTDSTLPDVFVALFSGEATSGAHKIHGAETGADDYIVKPVGREELLARIRTLIRLRDTTVALRASEQHYRTLVEILPDAVCLMDPEGRLDAINPQGLAMLGYQGQEEVLGRTLYNFAPADEHDRIRADLATVLHSGLIRGLEYTLLRNDGRRVPVELSATILKEEKGQTLELVAVMRDISRRKRAEEQIRVLADAVQSAQELISITDQENRLTFANQAFLQAYGYEEKEVLGKTPDMLRANANPLELTKQLYLQTMQGGWRGELMDRRRNGMEFPVSLATSPIRNSKGQTIGFVWLGRDITERRRVEKQHTAFAQLGYRLSGATTAPEAAKIILDIASDLFGWDAGYVQAYSVADDRMLSLLAVDTIQGRKAPITSDPAEPPSALKREVMKEGGRLVNGDGVPSQSSE